MWNDFLMVYPLIYADLWKCLKADWGGGGFIGYAHLIWNVYQMKTRDTQELEITSQMVNIEYSWSTIVLPDRFIWCASSKVLCILNKQNQFIYESHLHFSQVKKKTKSPTTYIYHCKCVLCMHLQWSFFFCVYVSFRISVYHFNSLRSDTMVLVEPEQNNKPS